MRRFMLWGILALVVGAGLIAWPFLGGRMAQVVGWRSSSYSSQGLLETLVLVDRQARIRAYHLPDDEQSLERLRQNVRIVLREKPKER